MPLRATRADVAVVGALGGAILVTIFPGAGRHGLPRPVFAALVTTGSRWLARHRRRSAPLAVP